MPSAPTLVAFAVATIALSLLPGPSVLFIVGRSIAHGRRAGLVSVIGADAGALVLVVLVALGVGALIAASEAAYWVVKIAGAAYLVYLGVQTIRHRRDVAVGEQDGPSRPLGGMLSQSFVVGVTNPKTWRS